MTAIKYRKLLNDPRWKKTAQRIRRRDKHRCVKCGRRSAQIDVHHTRYLGAYPWETPDKYLVSICDRCHRAQHGRQDLVDKVAGSARGFGTNFVGFLFWVVTGLVLLGIYAPGVFRSLGAAIDAVLR